MKLVTELLVGALFLAALATASYFGITGHPYLALLALPLLACAVAAHRRAEAHNHLAE